MISPRLPISKSRSNATLTVRTSVIKSHMKAKSRQPNSLLGTARKMPRSVSNVRLPSFRTGKSTSSISRFPLISKLQAEKNSIMQNQFNKSFLLGELAVWSDIR